jgi:hypothetical protein
LIRVTYRKPYQTTAINRMRVRSFENIHPHYGGGVGAVKDGGAVFFSLAPLGEREQNTMVLVSRHSDYDELASGL